MPVDTVVPWPKDKGAERTWADEVEDQRLEQARAEREERERTVPRPCPFCGSSNVALYPPDPIVQSWVACRQPGCLVYGPGRNTKAEAIAAWNRRAGG